MAEIEDVVRRIVREEVRAALRDWQQGGVAALAAPAAEVLGALSIEDAAKYLGLRDGGAVRGLIARHEIGSVKVGRTTVIPRAALDEYLDRHTMSAQQNPWGLTAGALRNVRKGRSAGHRS